MVSNTLQFPDDLHELPITLIVEGTPAWEVACRICEGGPVKPGQFFAVSEEEMASFRRDVLRLTLIKGDKEEGK